MQELDMRFSAVPGWMVGRMGGLALSAFGLMVPLSMWLGFADGVEFPKHIVVRVLVLMLSLTVVLRPQTRTALLAHPLALPLGLLSLASLVSTAMCAVPAVSWSGEDGSWKGSSTLVAVWLGALCAGTLASGRSAHKWAMAVLVSAGLALAYGMVQAVGADPVSWDPGRRLAYWVMATLGNPVHLGNFLVCAFFLSLVVLPGPAVSRRVFRLIILAGIIATLSRSALLSLFAGGIIWLGMKGSRVPRAGTLAMAVAPLAVFPFLGQLERLFSLTRLTGARLQIWEVAVRMAVNNPLVGAGPDLFYSYFPSLAGYRFYSAEPPAIFGDTIFLRLPASAHSEIFDTVSMLGIPALGLYVWALVVVVMGCRRSPFLPALAALWVGHQVNPSSVATSALFWTLAAVACRSGKPAGIAGKRGVVASGIIFAMVLMTLAPVLRMAGAQAYRRESGRLLFIGDRFGALALQERWGKWAAHAHPRQLFDDSSLVLTASSPGGQEKARGLLALAQSGNPFNIFYASASAELDYNEGRRLGSRKLLADSEAGFRRLLDMAPSALSLHDDLARVLEAEGRGKEAEVQRRARRLGDPRGLFAPKLPPGRDEK